jgi:hypothetical protein
MTEKMRQVVAETRWTEAEAPTATIMQKTHSAENVKRVVKFSMLDKRPKKLLTIEFNQNFFIRVRPVVHDERQFLCFYEKKVPFIET